MKHALWCATVIPYAVAIGLGRPLARNSVTVARVYHWLGEGY